MAVPRSESQRERDRALASDLYLQGWNQQEIANKLGISRQAVNRDIKFLLAEWRKNRNGLVDEFEAKYRLIYREAYAAWLRSKEDAVTEVSEMVEGDGTGKGNGQRLKASTRKEGQSGNPALLAEARAALKAIREMFGTDAPTKAQNINLDLSQLTNEQLQRIAAGEDPIHVASSTQSGG